jgi:hypothetical protein
MALRVYRRMLKVEKNPILARIGVLKLTLQ